jgi:transcriptional regulator with XRE-family HTH domain
MDNKDIFALNLKRYMKSQGKSRNDISEALGISYFTVSDWVNGKKYPRMDKVEMLANYFGIQKSDLIEDKTKLNLQLFTENSPEEPRLTEGEKMLLDIFRLVPEENKQMVVEMIRAALKTKG